MALSALPDPPDHSDDDIPLVFDRWNYSLEDIKEELEYTSKVTVGANYHTADGLTHLVWKVEAGDQVRITSVSSGATIDWGDGQTTTGQTSSILHTYADAGVYDCKVSGLSIIVGHSYAEFVKNYTRLSEIRLSNGITSIGDEMFRSCHSLQSISIPQSVTSIGNNAFGSCYFATLVFESVAPPAVSSTNSFTRSNITKIVVPKGCLEAYKSATNLSQMADKMVEADE